MGQLLNQHQWQAVVTLLMSIKVNNTSLLLRPEETRLNDTLGPAFRWITMQWEKQTQKQTNKKRTRKKQLALVQV